MQGGGGGVLEVDMTGVSDVSFGLKIYTLGIFLGQEIGHVCFFLFFVFFFGGGSPSEQTFRCDQCIRTFFSDINGHIPISFAY